MRVEENGHSAREMELRLQEMRDRLANINTLIDDLLMAHRDLPWSHFEAAQAQLYVYLRRAERLVASMKGAQGRSEWLKLLKDLEVTWDELATRTQQLVSKVNDIQQSLPKH